MNKLLSQPGNSTRFRQRNFSSVNLLSCDISARLAALNKTTKRRQKRNYR